MYNEIPQSEYVLTDRQLYRYFKSYEEEPSGCWRWTESVSWGGYGRFRANRKCFTAHRLGFFLHRGHVPAGLDLDHLCRNRACVNPAHLEVVTRSVNLRRGAKAGVTQCPYGHPYDEENTLVEVNSGGYMARWCKECKRIQSRRRYARINWGLTREQAIAKYPR